MRKRGSIVHSTAAAIFANGTYFLDMPHMKDNFLCNYNNSI
jgi:hypothetical protein